MKNILPVIIYLACLAITFLIFSAAWSQFVAKNLYFSTDPIYFLDIVPPFVNTNFGEYFIVNEIAVWILWLAFILLIVFLPYLFTKKLQKEIN